MLEKILASWNFIADVIFPPTEEEILLRTFSYERFEQEIPQAPTAAFPFIAALFAYKNPLVAELVWEIKNKKNRHALEIGSRALYEKICQTHLENIILVPVPISKKRRKERGYNQCEFLIDEILKLDKNGKQNKKVGKRFDILCRTKHAETKQAFKNRTERLESSQNIFEAKAFSEILDCTIIIIDDVVTTGSTVKAARDALLKAGYKNVRVLVLSH